MIASMRRGACPALSAPMQTGDGLLVRLNQAAESLSGGQLSDLCAAATRHGNGIVEVTSRGNLQLRGISNTTIDGLRADIDALQLRPDEGVSISIGPLAGLDMGEVSDPRPLAAALRTKLAASGVPSLLGPKVSVVIDGGGAFSLASLNADVRLSAQHGGGSSIWRLVLGGDAATATGRGPFDAPDAVEACLSVLGSIADAGKAARAKDLLSRLPTPDKPNAPPPIGTHPLRDGRVAVAVALPFGSINARRLAILVEAAQAQGIVEFRFAPQRLILALAPSAEIAAAFHRTAETFGLVTSAADSRLRIFACVGAPACASGHISSRAIATALVADVEKTVGTTIHVSGCAKGCAHPSPTNLTFVGSAEGIGIVRDGTARGKPIATLRNGRSPQHQIADWMNKRLSGAPTTIDSQASA